MQKSNQKAEESVQRRQNSCGTKEQLSRWLQYYCSFIVTRQQQSCENRTNRSIWHYIAMITQRPSFFAWTELHNYDRKLHRGALFTINYTDGESKQTRMSEMRARLCITPPTTHKQPQSTITTSNYPIIISWLCQSPLCAFMKRCGMMIVYTTLSHSLGNHNKMFSHAIRCLIAPHLRWTPEQVQQSPAGRAPKWTNIE